MKIRFSFVKSFIVKEIKEMIINELKSNIQTDEEIENSCPYYDDDNMYAYGQQAGYEHATEIVEEVFKNFGF